MNYHTMPQQKYISSQKQIETIISNFNFEEVQQVMQFLDWKWASSRTESGIPSVGELVVKAIHLLQGVNTYLQGCHGNSRYSSATGGLHATGEKYEDGEIALTLQFVTSEFNWSNKDTCY